MSTVDACVVAAVAGKSFVVDVSPPVLLGGTCVAAVPEPIVVVNASPSVAPVDTIVLAVVPDSVVMVDVPPSVVVGGTCVAIVPGSIVVPPVALIC